ncbi:MAG: YraN family protein [Bacteroidetes bacterium]|nr:YraN family protein [Bacteroidota bacterium]
MQANHLKIGLKGERAAARFMEERGYLILERNWRCGRAEIDLICGRDEELVFIEVKTRSSDYFGEPETFVQRPKKNRMEKAAIHFLEKLSGAYSLRFDIISVKVLGNVMEIRHFENAFMGSREIWS